jgi:hypothetical protein
MHMFLLMEEEGDGWVLCATKMAIILNFNSGAGWSWVPCERG